MPPAGGLGVPAIHFLIQCSLRCKGTLTIHKCRPDASLDETRLNVIDGHGVEEVLDIHLQDQGWIRAMPGHARHQTPVSGGDSEPCGFQHVTVLAVEPGQDPVLGRFKFITRGADMTHPFLVLLWNGELLPFQRN